MEEKNDMKEGAAKQDFKKPAGAKKLHTIQIDGKRTDYQAEADWIILRKDDKPKAEMFYVHYSLVAEEDSPRPVTFVFNGGPGASSVYLHIGAVGPRRVDLDGQGVPGNAPYRLVDNAESWLSFTDLVFIDPVGTGFSRMIEDDEAKKKTEEKPEYWKLKRDLESLSEFMRKFLSEKGRWESSVYIAGESYGGFRVGKLAKMLQKDYGVGLAGAVIISPALEFVLLNGSDYDALPWVDTFPSMAGAAAFHGLSRKLKGGEELSRLRQRASEFAINELLPVLAGGELVPEARRSRVYNTAADYLGLPRETVRRCGGRIGIEYFVRNLLRKDGKLLGLYDSSITVTDPYPDREGLEGPDPTLDMLERVFAAGINSQLRASIGLSTERDYNLISMKVNEGWDVDTRAHSLDTQVGAVDDLRYGMSLNPGMKVFLSHGYYDLVTPYFSAERLKGLMKLTDGQRKQLQVKHYDGGHMFYTWEASRREFFGDMKEFYGK